MNTPKPKPKPKPKLKPTSKLKPKPGSDVFDGADVAATPVSGCTALQVSGRGRANANPNPLSAAQKRFNKLLQSIDRLQAQITEAQVLTDTYRLRYANTLTPLRAQQTAALRRMALYLDERLARKGLTPAQQRDLAEILCSLCEMLAVSGDKVMEALHDKHSAQSLQDKQSEEAAKMRGMMKNALGDRFDRALDEDESLEPMARLEALIRAAQEQAILEEALHAEHQQASKARKSPSTAQLKAGQQRADAQSVLRQLYRQLASALHPDRERDPGEHRRKTALMSEANAAYAAQDLVALLHIQQRMGPLEPDAVFELPEKNIAAMTTLLKKQANALEDELFGRYEELQQTFDLDFHRKPTHANLQDSLALQEELLQDELAQLEEDLEMVQDDAGLKRWLKIQKQLARETRFF